MGFNSAFKGLNYDCVITCVLLIEKPRIVVGRDGGRHLFANLKSQNHQVQKCHSFYVRRLVHYFKGAKVL